MTKDEELRLADICSTTNRIVTGGGISITSDNQVMIIAALIQKDGLISAANIQKAGMIRAGEIIGAGLEKISYRIH